MKLINDILYARFNECVEAGIPVGTIRSAQQRKQADWQFLQDPTDARKVLIAYEPLKQQYKDLLIKKFGNPYLSVAHSKLESLVTTDHNALLFYRNYKLANGKGLPDTHIAKYTKAASWLQLLTRLSSETGRYLIKQLSLTAKQLWEAITSLFKTKHISLPTSYTRLTRKINEFKERGYVCLVSGKFLNKNPEKINPEISAWLVANYALFNKPRAPELTVKYTAEAIQRGWPQLTIQAIFTHVHRPDIIQQWYLGRNGELEFEKRFGAQQKLKLPTYRDALWFSDGTGFNFECSDSKMQRIYWVMDAYSEVILGWDCARTEQHQVVYNAAKKALQFSQAKPVEWRYDNGSAHERMETFFDKATSKLHFPCTPYRGSSKTIEPLTGRFQQQLMRKWWFFTGQNRGSRSLDSRQNEVVVDKNKRLLPTLKEILMVHEAEVQAWNNAPHPKTGIPRLQMYQESVNPNHVEVSVFDMIDMFFLETECTYTARGIQIKIGQEKYEYEVIKEELPDTDFRRNYIGQVFTVKYDPADLSYCALYIKSPAGLQFVTIAPPKIETHLATIDHVPGEKKLLTAMANYRKGYLADSKEYLKQLEDYTGISGDKLIEQQNEEIKRMSIAEQFRDDDMAADARFKNQDSRNERELVPVVAAGKDSIYNDDDNARWAHMFND